MKGKVEVQSESMRDFAIKQKKVIRHYKCFVHKLHNLQKHLKNIRLTTKLSGFLTSKLSGFDKEVYLNRLLSVIPACVFCFVLFDLILYVHSTIFQLCGTGIPACVHLELVIMKAHFPSCSCFINHSEDAIADILPCFFFWKTWKL